MSPPGSTPEPKGIKMKTWFCILVFSCFCCGILNASEIETGKIAEVPVPNSDELELKDGTVLVGQILEETDDLVIIDTEILGRLEISRDQIKILRRAGKSDGRLIDPDQNSLMFCPTPATLPKGTGYFRSFELFFLNLGFSATDDLDFSVGTLFPVTTDVLMLSGGFKWRVLDRDEGPLGLALVGNYTKLENSHFGGVGAVLGIGDARKSLNFSVNQTFDDSDNQNTIFFVGADIQGGGNSKLFVEYFNSSAIFNDEDDDIAGFINIGIRLFGEKHSFSISGFRPLEADSDSFIAFPMVMFSQHW